MRDFSLRVCVLACLVCGLTSCDEGKFNAGKCDETYVAECLDRTHFMFCDNGELRVTGCGQDAYCTPQTVGTDAEGKPVMGAAECRLADNSKPERVPVVTPDDRCKEGETKCDGNNAMVCKNSIWEISRKCGVACKDGACTGAPGLDEEQAASCAAEGKKECDKGNVRTCFNGKWSIEQCTFGCGSTTLSCLELNETKACADNGQSVCSDGKSWTCDANHWKFKKCLTGCEETMGICLEDMSETCTEEGKIECADTSSRTCTGGRWVVTACSVACDVNTGKCLEQNLEPCTEDGKSECVGTNTRMCLEGVWIVFPCTEPCDVNTGSCPGSGELCAEEGKSECVGTNSRTCKDAVWKENTCNNGCDEATGQCNVSETPNPGETSLKCTDEELADCKSNEYKACAIVEGEPLCYDDTCTQEGNPQYTCKKDDKGFYSYFVECVKADDGSLVVYTNYFDCSSQQCTESTGQCVKSVSDEFAPCDKNYPNRCENNYAVYCSKYGDVMATSCGENACLTVDGLADCYGESDKCTELNATQKGCIEDDDGYGYDVTLTCKKASDDNTYWTVTGGDECPNEESCNDEGTACEGSAG